jgi:replicative DNA helicase
MHRKEIVTVETGVDVIDRQLTGGGFEKGMFHVIGARPGKGKTSLALDIATHNFLARNVTVFFTMELSRDVLMDRLVAPLAGIERWKLTSKYISNIEIAKLHKTVEFLNSFPFYINHKARSIADMRLALQEIARKTGGKIDLVVVDFLTKMRLEKRDKYASVSANANGLAEFATDFGCAVVCLSQLSRENVRRTAAEPGRVELTDFRDSGEIEELGRTIFGLWGEDDTDGRRHRTVHCTCLKQGEGRLFDEMLVFDSHFMTFGVRQCLIQPMPIAA